MRADATGMSEVKVRRVHAVRLAVGVTVALFFGVLAPVLLVNGAAGLFVAGAVVAAVVSGVDAAFSADSWLRSLTPANSAAAHTLAA